MFLRVSVAPTSFAFLSDCKCGHDFPKLIMFYLISWSSLQAQLGELKMGLIRKAEKENLKRAKKHVKYRRRDWMIGGTCIGIIIGVYSYTIWAMQQETFLDDFEVPNPIPEDEEDK